ncbi:MAG: preprotein translocase subunit SecG [Patescibacteria group bacterium]
MKSIILIAQIAISISLIIVILLQSKGTGLGTAFGGSSQVYRSRRGVEKLFMYLTITLVVLFFVISILQVLVK